MLACADVTDAELRSADYGSPLAILAARGVITTLQKEAALKADRIYDRWRLMSGAPPRQISDRSGPETGDCDPVAWRRAKADFAVLEGCLATAGILARSTVESVVFDGWLPVIWFDSQGRIRTGYCKAIEALRVGLDAIVRAFGLEAKNPLAA
jgi:hypothetical protein